MVGDTLQAQGIVTILGGTPYSGTGAIDAGSYGSPDPGSLNLTLAGAFSDSADATAGCTGVATLTWLDEEGEER